MSLRLAQTMETPDLLKTKKGDAVVNAALFLISFFFCLLFLVVWLIIGCKVGKNGLFWFRLLLAQLFRHSCFLGLQLI